MNTRTDEQQQTMLQTVDLSNENLRQEAEVWMEKVLSPSYDAPWRTASIFGDS